MSLWGVTSANKFVSDCLTKLLGQRAFPMQVALNGSTRLVLVIPDALATKVTHYFANKLSDTRHCVLLLRCFVCSNYNKFGSQCHAEKCNRLLIVNYLPPVVGRVVLEFAALSLVRLHG